MVNIMSDELYSEESLKSLVNASDRIRTQGFFEVLNNYAKQGKPIPNHWIVVASQMLVDASEARKKQPRTKNPLADALCMKKDSKFYRNAIYGQVVAYFFLKTGKINHSCEQAKELIESESDAIVSESTLKSVFYEHEENFLHLAELFYMTGKKHKGFNRLKSDIKLAAKKS